LSVRTLVSRYFSQRKAYLQGAMDTINTVVEPMITDEAEHRAELVKLNVIFNDSTVVINTVLVGDYLAEVTATETVTFRIAGELIQEVVVHTVCVYENREKYLIVSSDGYREVTTGFISASYISTETAELMISSPTGSPDCIVGVAMNEIGYTEGPPVTYLGNGYNKYGDWYDSVTGSETFAYDYWCVTFVVWCANQANVSNYVIPLTGVTTDMVSFFRNQGRHYYSAAGGGSYTPQPGDLIYFNDSYSSPRHIGIVSIVYDGVVYYIDGNAPYTINGETFDRVSYRSKSLTSTDIVGYSNPNYLEDTHTLTHWESDEYVHGADCQACGLYISEPHFWIDGYAGLMCEICGYIP